MDEFTKTFIVQNSWARAGTMTRVFAEMAEDAYELYLVEIKNRIPRPHDNDYSTARTAQDHVITKLGVRSIVFSAMALESGIFELAAINLGDETASDYLDKLDLLGKWVIVPQLICGRSLAERGAALNGLRSLIKARNRLVHYKSMPLPWNQNDSESARDLKIKKLQDKMDASSARFAQDVRASYQTLILISLELETLIGTVGPLPWFSLEIQASDRRNKSAALNTLIGDCKAINQKQREKI